eukprot:747574-Hanusia_phi.AAC.1
MPAQSAPPFILITLGIAGIGFCQAGVNWLFKPKKVRPVIKDIVVISLLLCMCASVELSPVSGVERLFPAKGPFNFAIITAWICGTIIWNIVMHAC